MKIGITGISSPLAQVTAKKLLALGHEVIGFSRDPTKIDLAGVVLHSGDLRNRKRVKEILEGCEVIIHIGALSTPWGDKKDFEEVNVKGTGYVIEAALEGGCRRLIHISTPSLYFDYRDKWEIQEEAVVSKPVNHYARSKKKAEKLIDEAFRLGLETITLRPRALFGPGDTVLMPRILKALAKGGVPRFRSKEPLIDVTYIENVADAILCAVVAEASICSGKKYNITNGEPVGLYALFQEILSEIGVQYREKRISYPLARAIAFIAELASRFSGEEPLLTSYSVGVLSFSQTLCIQKAVHELGYRPRISLKEGIKAYGLWWRDNESI